MLAIKETNAFCIKNEVVPLQSQQCQIILVSCQQCIVWWSCQCHLRFVFYVICKSATFLRDITFVILRFKFPYWVNLQEGGKRREPQSARNWLSKSIDLKYVIIVASIGGAHGKVPTGDQRSAVAIFIRNICSPLLIPGPWPLEHCSSFYHRQVI